MNDYIIEGGEDDPGAQQEPAPNVVADLESRMNSRLASLTEAVTEAVTGMSRQRDEDRAASEAARMRAAAQGVEQRARQAETAARQAQTALEQAIEGGDAKVIAAAQAAVVDTRIAATSARNDLRRVEQTRRNPPAPTQSEPAAQQPKRELDTSNLDRWKSRNKSWYGVDDGMTRAAHEIDASIRAAGVITEGSQEYFEAVDTQMTKRFPQVFNRAPDTGSGSSGAPAQGREPAGQTRIPAHVFDGWKRMGLNTDDPEVVKRLVGPHRAKLVEKGILAPQMNRERVTS